MRYVIPFSACHVTLKTLNTDTVNLHMSVAQETPVQPARHSHVPCMQCPFIHRQAIGHKADRSVRHKDMYIHSVSNLLRSVMLCSQRGPVHPSEHTHVAVSLSHSPLTHVTLAQGWTVKGGNGCSHNIRTPQYTSVSCCIARLCE